MLSVPDATPATKLPLDVPSPVAPVGSVRRNPLPNARSATTLTTAAEALEGIPVTRTVSPADGMCGVNSGGTGPADSGRVSSTRTGGTATKRPAATLGVGAGVNVPSRSTTTLPPAYRYSVIDPSTPMGTTAKFG